MKVVWLVVYSGNDLWFEPAVLSRYIISKLLYCFYLHKSYVYYYCLVYEINIYCGFQFRTLEQSSHCSICRSKCCL